jgi:hypothetical protein
MLLISKHLPPEVTDTIAHGHPELLYANNSTGKDLFLNYTKPMQLMRNTVSELDGNRFPF